MDQVPLIDPPARSMTLADGRRLSWQEFGAPDGRPVLYFHGGGSFCLEAGLFHREAVKNNIRLIATNRPGAGDTDLCPGRPVAAYSDDLEELLDALNIDTFACLGESNGGLVTLAVAATMGTRVLGGVPINPTIPWFDPLARSVSSREAALAYRLMKYLPSLLVWLAASGKGRIGMLKNAVREEGRMFSPEDLVGPPPGTEQDIAALHWRVMEQSEKRALSAEIKWGAMDWGFDYYSIAPKLDVFCGAYDAQAPFALVLADRNPDARFRYFSYGHYGFSHPSARRRIFDTISGYFDA